VSDANDAATSIGRTIARYREGRIGFPELVSSIEWSINSLLGRADSEWIDELRSVWGGLEAVYASLLDESREVMTNDERSGIEDTLDALTAMVVSY
jgi:hypothetical protein